MRRAEALARERGRPGYTVRQYKEGIESTMPFARRVAYGVVSLASAPRPPEMQDQPVNNP